MSIIQGNALSNGSSGYTISRSLRFRSSASAYLSRTPSVASGQNQWTLSTWVKRGILNSSQFIIGGNTTTSGGVRNILTVEFGSDNTLQVYAFTNASGYYFQRVSSAVYRDPAAWYHLVVQFDPDNATSANKVIAYVNGQQVSWGTSSDSGPGGSINSSAYRSINNTYRNDINGGYQGGGAPIYFGDGYQTEIRMVSGSIVSPNSFGGYNSYGQWQPITYGGSYGTNGFYLPFTNNASTTTLGYDFSPNGNNWTTNNISLTAGTTYDSMTDVPTLTSATAANYCVLNPLDRSTSTNAPVPTNGNLAYATASVIVTWSGVKGTISFSTGKYYFEDDISSLGVNSIGFAGWTDSDTIAGDMSNYFSKMGGLLIRNDSAGIGEAKMVFGTTTSLASGADATNGLFQLAIDFDAGKFWIGKNNTWFGSGDPAAGTNQAGTFTANRQMTPLLIAHYGTTNGNITHAANFGQRPFTYTPPSGFVALNTYNL